MHLYNEYHFGYKKKGLKVLGVYGVEKAWDKVHSVRNGILLAAEMGTTKPVDLEKDSLYITYIDSLARWEEFNNAHISQILTDI